ncbi:MAG: Transglutaminase-like superfamily protein [Caldanaerobacter subterraneus]|uniref:DUF4129 domain-containing protein n=1 Tax=Caldanaerobacter subterraneus TaxID=911092 RepID=A0A101E363_9THEO|nr:transglutaminase domain-containing protein [Caldanaerobacter subterraneus]KUK08330.1 MAG: Transglutaminase-like superfamily protein [Caldanaerobacter subterraneus]MBE3578828.1 transglutaminase domain-containing protein [Caldanaerobacter subterraneus]TCO67556.1 uncharacterized protein DUF4129 [Caldanaerobacter subterraneus]HBT48590.1 DUF4129 domain-containing protein [Caldanaerobacter subterraneus]
MGRRLKEVLYEYSINIALSLVVVFSALEGFKFHFPWFYVFLLTAVSTIFFLFLLKRPLLIVLLLIIILIGDFALFFGYRDILVSIFLYIEGFVKWINAYMNYAPSSPAFSALTEKYKVFTLFVTVGIVTFLISAMNGLMRSWFLTLLSGMIFFVVQWYNYVDKAYFYLMVYVLLCFTDIGVKNYFRKNGLRGPLSAFLAIVMLFSSISAFGAELMPKAFSPLKWDRLENWFYDTFPFTREWRNGEGKPKGTPAEDVFVSFASDLGGAAKVSNSVVMEVETKESTYLRGMVYDQYVTSPSGKSRWTNYVQQYRYENVGGVIPVTFSRNVKYQIKSLKIIPVNIKSDILFSPWQPYKLSDSFYYEEENLNLKAKTSHATGEPYFVIYLTPSIDLKDLKEKGSTSLSEEERKRYLSYPSNLPERVKELAYSLTKDKQNQYDKVKAVEEYLRKFPYSLDVPPTPPGRDFVDYFLFDLKKGYCTHYATAMAVMLRTVGIPTRYVVGFKLPPAPDKNGKYIVTTADAHAWVEVYFDDYGWVTFEPTPHYPSIEFPIFLSSTSSDLPKEDILPDNRREEDFKNIEEGMSQSEKVTGSENAPVDKKKEIKLIEVLGAFLLIMASSIFALYFKKKKTLDKDEKYLVIYYYDKIVRKLSKRGFTMRDSETTLEYQERVAKEGYKDFEQITRIYNKTVYGSKRPSLEEIKRMKEFFDSLKKERKFDIKRILRI